MTVKEQLIKNQMDRGMSKEQASTVIALSIPVLDNIARNINGVNRNKETGEEKAIDPYLITWDSPSTDYPDSIYAIWQITINPIAFKWIEENKPMAWFKNMFIVAPLT